MPSTVRAAGATHGRNCAVVRRERTVDDGDGLGVRRAVDADAIVTANVLFDDEDREGGGGNWTQYLLLL